MQRLRPQGQPLYLMAHSGSHPVPRWKQGRHGDRLVVAMTDISPPQSFGQEVPDSVPGSRVSAELLKDSSFQLHVESEPTGIPSHVEAETCTTPNPSCSFVCPPNSLLYPCIYYRLERLKCAPLQACWALLKRKFMACKVSSAGSLSAGQAAETTDSGWLLLIRKFPKKQGL